MKAVFSFRKLRMHHAVVTRAHFTLTLEFYPSQWHATFLNQGNCRYNLLYGVESNFRGWQFLDWS